MIRLLLLVVGCVCGGGVCGGGAGLKRGCVSVCGGKGEAPLVRVLWRTAVRAAPPHMLACGRHTHAHCENHPRMRGETSKALCCYHRG
jgi:hypothetical protein